MIYTSDCSQCAHERVCGLRKDYEYLVTVFPGTKINYSAGDASLDAFPYVNFRASCTEFMLKHFVQTDAMRTMDPSTCTDEEE